MLEPLHVSSFRKLPGIDEVSAAVVLVSSCKPASSPLLVAPWASSQPEVRLTWLRAPPRPNPQDRRRPADASDARLGQNLVSAWILAWILQRKALSTNFGKDSLGSPRTASTSSFASSRLSRSSSSRSWLQQKSPGTPNMTRRSSTDSGLSAGGPLAPLCLGALPESLSHQLSRLRLISGVSRAQASGEHLNTLSLELLEPHRIGVLRTPPKSTGVAAK